MEFCGFVGLAQERERHKMLESVSGVHRMLNTTESLCKRTGPFDLKWLTPMGTEQSKQFDNLDEALEVARQFNEQQQRLSLRIEPATGEAMHYDKIAERLGWV
jgi:hypothetical protein